MVNERLLVGWVLTCVTYLIVVYSPEVWQPKDFAPCTIGLVEVHVAKDSYPVHYRPSFLNFTTVLNTYGH